MGDQRSISAREEILTRVRTARPRQTVAVPRDYLTATSPAEPGSTTAASAGAGPLELLAERLDDYRAEVRRCIRPELADALAGLLRDVPVVVVPPGLPPEWLARYPGLVRRDGEPEPVTVSDLDTPGLAVVTGCTVAVARTGTLILDGSADQGRRMLTLVPDHHVCVVSAAQVVTALPEALHRLADPTRPLTLISGPSATSDIELNRVEGVHGPRRLAVLIVTD